MFNGLIKRKALELKDKVAMYDMMLANLLAGNSIIEPNDRLDSSKIEIQFSSISSETQVTKYFILERLPDYLPQHIIDIVRNRCLKPTVKINFYIYGQQHKIKWDSPEMKNKISIWKNYTKSVDQSSPLDYREKRSDNMAKSRIIDSTMYFNVAELDHKRTLSSVILVMEVIGSREGNNILQMSQTIGLIRSFFASIDLSYKEASVNMLDWVSFLGPLSLRPIKEVQGRVVKKILTDDILANFNGYKQGRIGYNGVPLGLDIATKSPVLRKFKEDPDAPENWLIAAITGGGKSMFIKVLLIYLLADGFVVTVMDYEGDEYYNLASFIRAGNTEDVKIISMGKGSAIYFDPMEIAELTGDHEIDQDLKENAINFTMSIFRVITCGLENELDQWEERVISTAIKRVYDKAGVTDDNDTWIKSKGLRLHDVYNEIKAMSLSKEFVDVTTNNVKHYASVKITEGASTYFEKGEAKAGTFSKPMSVNELFKAKFIVFSFGMKGATSSQIDPIVLALKQLSVANVSIQISNYCKYVRKCFNVKVWEEYQRWGEVKGSSEIITNAMTGGRKRGDVNFMVTNDLQSILDKNNPVSARIRQNITSMAIGSIKDTSVIDNFCELYGAREIKDILYKISKAGNTDNAGDNKGGSGGKYKYAFCLRMDNGKHAVVKVMLPMALRKSSLFKTGVAIESDEATNEYSSTIINELEGA